MFRGFWVWLRRRREALRSKALTLPPAQHLAEDAFVATWRDDFGDLDVLREAVRLAVNARRLRLAGRLASLLPEHDDDALILKARAASRFVVLRGGFSPPSVSRDASSITQSHQWLRRRMQLRAHPQSTRRRNHRTARRG